jgi:PD-(D/E)XK endonuclease
MAKCQGFKNFKVRGEWVELQFMAQAMRHRFEVAKPWGDSSSYDVGVEHQRRYLRVQVKSTSYRIGNGYLCSFKPNHRGGRYTIRKVDFFAAYVIPVNAWYILPSRVVLKTKSHDLMLCPGRPKARSDGNRYEIYLEAWHLLRAFGARPQPRSGDMRKPGAAVPESEIE